jgi:hypothetical protein
VSYKGDTLITLRNIDADDLSFFQGNLFLQPNPDPSLL